MNALTTFSYAGSKITFSTENGVTVNATQMAKPFGKRPVDWLRFQSSQEFIVALAEVRNHTSAELVRVIKGGNGEQGTWMHEDVALEFARWLSPKFAIWCNDRIKELLTAPQQPSEPSQLPPPIGNQQVTLCLVESVDGKAVTTSRKVAVLLGRKHDQVLRTIRNNLHARAFKYGNFTVRPYGSGPSHGYEFVITRRGLDALASVMRHNARERIAEAYAAAWDGMPRQLPAPADGKGHETENEEDDITFLWGWIGELRGELRAARRTIELWAEECAEEKRRARRNGDTTAYWHDLYEDIMLRLGCLEDADGLIAAHNAFRKRISEKA